MVSEGKAMSRKDSAKDAAMKSPSEIAPTNSASRAAIITDLLREMTRRERLVLALRYTEELTVAEIAAVMEIAATEVERMLDSISERVRRRLAPVYTRARFV
jgi:DNA-directed RNA polymerase specialized sigma subunit